MKYICSWFLAVLSILQFSSQISAQESVKRIKPLSAGVGISLFDYKTAGSLYATNNLTNLFLKDNQLADASDLYSGLHGCLSKGITENIDVMTYLGAGLSKYGLKNIDKKVSKPFVESRIMVALKLFPDNYWISPYMATGLGLSMYNGKDFMATLPIAGGLNINLGKNNFIYLQSVIPYQLNDKGRIYLNYNLGFATAIIAPKEKKKVVVAPPPPPPVEAKVEEKDSDNDGIVDSKDNCPREAGLPKYNGCPIPDSDKDGINDEEDKCPKNAGVARYNGCPIPDTDKDGINDEEDKCPKEMGLARYNGCPIPDSDKDGVNDEEDKCPTIAGVKSNAGCPEIQNKINQLAKNIQFSSNSSVILPSAIPLLNEVADILKKNPSAKLTIEGHTDNSGDIKKNKVLSQKRADAIKSYFVKKGIELIRLTAIGYGPEKPIADNKTLQGRKQNRRVELKSVF